MSGLLNNFFITLIVMDEKAKLELVIFFQEVFVPFCCSIMQKI